MRRIAGAALLALVAAAPAHRATAAAPAAKVSFLEGKADREANGATSPLADADPLGEGDTVITQEASRLEIKFVDESMLRVGPSAKLTLTAAHFGRRPEERKMTARLLFGKVWAKVTSIFSKDATFAVETENAVAGVRGTTFRVDANTDKSVLVRVYAGAVAVAKPTIYATGTPGERHEVQGPDEVSRDQWEHLVGRQMEISIAADGTPSPPKQFDPKAEQDDDWVKWNERRDQAARPPAAKPQRP